MVIIHCYTEDQQAEAFLHPLCTPGSDATTLAPDGPLAGSFFHGAYTWAAWYLRFMVRERALLSLEAAVRRLTSDPAERVGLRDRGVLRVGAFADVAVLDADSVSESGTTFEPNRLATGVRHVLVNGVPTLADGALTGRRAGQVLRR
jgi:N-acyl-D-amino-acid deacylase